jgi:hypothetical protein
MLTTHPTLTFLGTCTSRKIEARAAILDPHMNQQRTAGGANVKPDVPAGISQCRRRRAPSESDQSAGAEPHQNTSSGPDVADLYTHARQEREHLPPQPRSRA